MRDRRRKACKYATSAPLLFIRGECPSVKTRRFLRHPFDEGTDVLVALQGLPGVIPPQQFLFGKGRVYLAVADLMDGELLPALQGLGDEMVAVDVLAAERAAAQGARRILGGSRRKRGNVGEVGVTGAARHPFHIEACAAV